jgi:cytochrome b561
MHRIGGYHALAANALAILAGLHAAAALFHHYVMRDDILRRMLPWSPPSLTPPRSSRIRGGVAGG